MKLNRKGEGGFMEAMIAVMVVTLSLTAFMGVLSYNVLTDSPEETVVEEPALEFLDLLSIKDKKIVGDLDEEMEGLAFGYSAVKIKVVAIGNVSIESLDKTYGEKTDNIVRSDVGSVLLNADDGRTLLCSYEVIIWN